MEGALLLTLVSVLSVLMFSRSYTFHFEQVVLNYYVNGDTDFTTNVASLVRTLGTVAVLSLIFGVTMGAAICLTCLQNVGSSNSTSSRGAVLSGYEEEMMQAGFVEINRTEEGVTYRLTELGRRFLTDYRFLEQPEETIV